MYIDKDANVQGYAALLALCSVHNDDQLTFVFAEMRAIVTTTFNIQNPPPVDSVKLEDATTTSVSLVTLVPSIILDTSYLINQQHFKPSKDISNGTALDF